MTPLEIEILLHYHSRAVDYREGDFAAPAVRRTIDWFLSPSDGTAPLIEVDPHTNEVAGLSVGPSPRNTYRLTDRGQAFIDHICALPLPTCRWEIVTP